MQNIFISSQYGGIGSSLFKEQAFDGRRKIALAILWQAAPIHLYIYLHADESFLHLSGVGTRCVFLNHHRLVHFFVYGLSGVAFLLASPTFPRFRTIIRTRYQLFMTLIAIWALFSELAFLTVLEAELQSQPEFDRCNSFYFGAYCPSAIWSLSPTIVRITTIFCINLIFGLHFWIAASITLAYLVSLSLTIIPWASDLDGSIILTSALTLLTGLEALRLCHVNQIERNFGIEDAQDIGEQTKMEETILRTMLPERLLTQKDVVLSGRVDNLMLESYPLVTVVFCSFSKTDIVNVGNANKFLRMVSQCIAVFDQLVHRSGFCKVEHVREDYVVASSAINLGPGVDIDESGFEVAKMVAFAQALVENGNHIMDPSSNDRLHFRAGLHSGPLIGAIAGKHRRFYRLFGDTVNMAARMCQTAPEGAVQISEVTKKLITEEHDFDLKESSVFVKGKGLKSTFIVSPNGSESDSVRLCEAFSCEDFSNNGRESVQHDENVVCVRDSGGVSNLPPPHFVEDSEFSFNRCSENSLFLLFDRVVSKSRAKKYKRGSIIEFQKSMLIVSKSQTSSSSSEDASWVELVEMAYGNMDQMNSKHHDVELERQYLESTRVEEVRMTKWYLGKLTLAYAVFFLSMFIDLESDLSELDLWSSAVIVGYLMVLIHFCLWFLVLLWEEKTSKVCVKVATVASSVGMMAFVAVCESPFAILGALLLSILRHSHELPMTFLLSAGVTTLACLFISFFTFQEFSWRFFFTRSCMLVNIGMLQNYRLFHCQVLRCNWQLRKALHDKHQDLEKVLKDLMPSREAQEFVVERYQYTRDTFKDSRKSVDPHVMYSKDEVSHAVVLCSDLAGFTALCENLSPELVVNLLHNLWCLADSVVESYPKRMSGHSSQSRDWSFSSLQRPFKMDTVGDAYFVVSMMPDILEHTKAARITEMVNLARDVMKITQHYSVTMGPAALGVAPGLVQMRMGLAFGSLIAGVVGYLQPRYHVFGETIETASKLESKSLPGHLNICAECIQCLPSNQGPYPLNLLAEEHSTGVDESVTQKYVYTNNLSIKTKISEEEEGDVVISLPGTPQCFEDEAVEI